MLPDRKMLQSLSVYIREHVVIGIMIMKENKRRQLEDKVKQKINVKKNL